MQSILEVKIKFTYKTVAAIICYLFLQGCASIAASPRACEESVDSFLPTPIQIFVSNIFQVGDCAASSKLRIETGQFYKKNKNRLISELNGEWDNINYITYLGELFNCKQQDSADFKNFLSRNRIEIFGPVENENSPRKVMLNIGELIKKDEVLKDRCK